MAGHVFKLCALFLVPHIVGDEPTGSVTIHEAPPSHVAQEANLPSNNSSSRSASRKPASSNSSSQLAEDRASTSAITATQTSERDSFAQFLPSTTLLYAEIDEPAKLIDQILHHPVRHRIEKLDAIQQLYRSPQYKLVQLGQTFFEWQLGESWDSALRTVSDRGAYLAFDVKSNGAILAIRSSDETRLKKIAGTIVGYVEGEAKRNGNGSPVKRSKYRGHNAAKIDQVLIARIDDWFLVANNESLAKSVADRLIDRDTKKTLAQDRNFLEARKLRDRESSLWMYGNLAALRKLDQDNALFSGRTDQPFVELVAGGILEALKTSNYATGSLKLDQAGVEFKLSTPFDSARVEKSREFFFGANQNGFAPKPLLPANTIANLSAHRDIGKWWLSKELLFDESVIAQLAQADSQLSTVFAGLDFGEEVLGATEPGVQIIVTEQTFQKEYQPDIKLPSFAMVFRLKEGQNNVRKRFKIAYQSLMGLTNFNLSQQGNPQFEMETIKTGQGELVSATYFLEKDSPKGLINYNFSPTLAFSGKYLVVSSTRQLAEQLSDLAERADPSATIATNTQMTIDMNVVNRMLKDNRESLIAQNMVENGHGRKKAEQETDLILTVADFFKSTNLELKVNQKSIELMTRIDLK